MSLTGRFRFRKTLTGKCVLQLEEEKPPFWPFADRQKQRRRWHDARYPELLRPEVRGLVNLMDYVHGHPHANLAILATVRPGGQSGGKGDLHRLPRRIGNDADAFAAGASSH